MIKTPSGRYIEPAVEETIDGFAPRYMLSEPGPHAIHVNYLGKPIAGSPFAQTAISKPLQIRAQAQGQESAPPAPMAAPPPAQVASKTPQVGKVRVYGDGLKRAVTGRPAQFTVDMRESGAAPLGIRIEGPTEARIECRDNGNGTCTCEYVATEPGLYSIHVLYNEQPVTGSPFSAQVFVAGRENLDVGRVRVYGPGIEPTGRVASPKRGHRPSPHDLFRTRMSQVEVRVVCFFECMAYVSVLLGEGFACLWLKS